MEYKSVLFPDSAINDITQSVRWADIMVRSDLILGLIAHENDYTSNLTNTIRQQINSKKCLRQNKQYALKATSFVLKNNIERKVGCDAGIILSNTRENQFKVCLFEAKWPRLSTSQNSWDSIQKTAQTSHFSEQIRKQALEANNFGIWEMFYCEYDFGDQDQPAYMNYNTSSCIWHEDVYAQFDKRDNSKIWSDIELENLLSSAKSKGHSTEIDEMVKEVCLCNKGRLFTGKDYEGVFSDYGFPKKLLLIEYS
jgi:hypothetical protein